VEHHPDEPLDQFNPEEITLILSVQYALGLIFYEMIAGVPAIVADSSLGYLHKHQHVEVTPPSQIVTQTGDVRQFEPMIMRMLKKQPRERFPDMETILHLIELMLPDNTPLSYERFAVLKPEIITEPRLVNNNVSVSDLPGEDVLEMAESLQITVQ